MILLLLFLLLLIHVFIFTQKMFLLISVNYITSHQGSCIIFSISLSTLAELQADK